MSSPDPRTGRSSSRVASATFVAVFVASVLLVAPLAGCGDDGTDVRIERDEDAASAEEGRDVLDPEVLETAGIVVSDQFVGDDLVVVDEVYADVPGWIVIHLDENGEPGAVVGQTQVFEGPNIDVPVQLDAEVELTATLHAMLHGDAGTFGEWEPELDSPIVRDGEPVSTAFQQL